MAGTDILGDYLAILATSADPKQREMAAKAVLEELASGTEMPVADRAGLEARYAAEADVGVAALLSRALTRLRARDVLDEGDPTSRFDRKLTSGEREALTSLVARLRVVVDGVRGSGEFDGRYEVVSELPPGGMGRVLLGRRRVDGAPVAIKVLLEEHAQDEALRARFRREAQILERLDHPHIVRLHEWGEVGDRLYLVMEQLSGGDVADRLAAGRLPLRPSAAALLQTLDALAACHKAGIVHRDVKPANLFAAHSDGDMWVKLGDFGLAKDLSEPDGLTRVGTVMGTDPYTAPEQRQDPSQVGPAADLYAFGVTAYELLSGGALPVGDYPELGSFHPALPEGLDALVGRCLAPRPGERWPNAETLKAALAPLLAHF